jgi:hypothetical protein
MILAIITNGKTHGQKITDRGYQLAIRCCRQDGLRLICIDTEPDSCEACAVCLSESTLG